MRDRPLGPGALLVDAVRAIEQSHRRIAVVADEQGRLLGTLTDGDVRRCLLAGGTLETSVTDAMNPQPVTADVGSADGYVLDLLRRANVMALPLVDEAGIFQRIVHLTDLGQSEAVQDARGFAFAVIMAGGEGTRLRPLTRQVPKPMLEVGGVPMLERQIERLAGAGIGRVYISVNYLSHVIEAHFGDGTAFGIEIRYLREQERLGTAGALSLLPERPHAPILVMNGDILTYGVLRADGAFVTELAEKPSQRFLCNAGMYVVSPDCLDLVPSTAAHDITTLIQTCLDRRLPVAVFPVHEYWSDVGTPDDLEKARAAFAGTRISHG
jgi:dTDP-glucose pyrophosphorylase